MLVRARVKPIDIVTVYCSTIRSILEYASPVWHSGLTVAESRSIESVQIRCLKMIYPDLSYNQALFVSGLEKLVDRRLVAARNIFNGLKTLIMCLVIF